MLSNSLEDQTPLGWMVGNLPDQPVYFFNPEVLDRVHAEFRSGFPGMVTYAVKSNPSPLILGTLIQGGMTAFDVASVAEMRLVRDMLPSAELHYHNPIRSHAEIAAARGFGIASWSIDRMSELDKLGPIEGEEISVRLHLPVEGAAYHFGSKFGADPETCAALLQAVHARGGVPCMTFHPGTQCQSAAAWVTYIHTCAEIAEKTGIQLERLNVGGGFPADRGTGAPLLSPIFAAISNAVRDAFGDDTPELICEPGRALAAECFQLGLRVKALTDDAVFLNDGVFGALSEWRDLSPVRRMGVYSPAGVIRSADEQPRIVFGPTCDSLDCMDDGLTLPGDVAEGDIVIMQGMGAYGAATSTAFNGYGAAETVILSAATDKFACKAGHQRHAV